MTAAIIRIQPAPADNPFDQLVAHLAGAADGAGNPTFQSVTPEQADALVALVRNLTAEQCEQVRQAAVMLNGWFEIWQADSDFEGGCLTDLFDDRQLRDAILAAAQDNRTPAEVESTNAIVGQWFNRLSGGATNA